MDDARVMDLDDHKADLFQNFLKGLRRGGWVVDVVLNLFPLNKLHLN